MLKLHLALLALTLATAPLPAQSPAAAKPATKSTKPKSTPPKPAPLVPLNDRERAVQLLNRFTFGPRPGDVEHVLAQAPEHGSNSN